MPASVQPSGKSPPVAAGPPVTSTVPNVVDCALPYCVKPS
jgi:hypothetical protein